ncbi:tyrosine-type recombinase/integrase [Streptomyces sp. NPDC101455]|uniref:tyrosine-type recombinase/integrase n=1 Tax=Streptomyces sp. NPDC101455 TaxID=3366142 RepID=UPI003816622B
MNATEARGVQDGSLAGSARLELIDGVVHLAPESAMLEAMLQGWARQQRARFLNEDGTIKPREAMVRRLVGFTNEYPWQWQPADAEAFISHLRSPNRSRPIVMSTGRGYETTLALFMGFITDRRYGWAAECLERFGQAPQQIFHEDNRVAHVAEYEGQPGRRPLTYDEIQALFDAADGRAEDAQTRGRKGALTAMRDSALLKTIYAYGLRRNESRMLDIADLRQAQKRPQYGKYGGLYVRYGKASKGSPPKRRTVLTVKEFDWITDVLDRWVTEIRPVFSPGKLAALFVTERSSRMSLRGVNKAFTAARDAAGLPPELDLHCLRHSNITHLVEFDYPEKFVSIQAGHSHASTTAIYTGVSDEYRNRVIQRALKGRHPDLWETK